MKSRVKIQGAASLVKKFKAHPGLINRTMESVMKEEARALCIEYARVSGPGSGMTESPISQAKREVETDVRRVFATREKPWQIFELLKARDMNLAKAYWNAYKSRKPRKMAAILKKAGLPEGMSESAQRAARTGRGGRVPKDTPFVSLANAARVRVLVRKLQARVGMAKAGWLCAAKALGGRVRVKYLKSGAFVNVEAFPASVRAVARKFPGLGGARITSGGGKVTVEIFTYAGHARKALNDTDYQEATAKAQQKLAARFLLAVQQINKRLTGAA